MAAYTEVKSKHWTLTASTVDSLTITGQHGNVEVVHHGDDTSPVYLNVLKAAATPTIAGDDTEVVLAGERVRFSISNTATVVSVISAGTPRISVVGVL